MAEAVVGWLVCPIIKIVVEKAASDRMKWMGDGVSKALERLRNTLLHLQTVASAVQLRGSTDRCRNLRSWLQQLMDAVYEAQDVLDNFDDSVPHPESSAVRFGKRILGADERVNRLKDVVAKLEAIDAGSSTMLSATETIAAASVSRQPSGSNHTGPMRRTRTPWSGARRSCKRWCPGSFTRPTPTPSPCPSPSPRSGAMVGWGRPRWRSSCSRIRREDMDMTGIGFRAMWDEVLAPLRHGESRGSKIVVTTRQKIVATTLKAREFYLGDLPDNDIWSLFTRYAFGDDNIDKQSPELQGIGRKIAEKLRGSPLLAKAVGQMLGGRRREDHWRNVLEMDGFDEVSKTLELCYQNLPEHLQPCFAICSLFPKNWRFKRDKLVKIWMALDFIQPTSGKAQLEDVGSEYFDQLVDKAGGSEISRFDCERVEDAKKEIPKTIRHLSVSGDSGTVAQIKSRCDLKRLRTLLILKNPSSSLDQLPGDFFTELKGLRVLSLEVCNIIRLSERIGNLKYLRYLALCKSITKLPQALTKLYRLQTFSSPKGSGLEVPEDIVNLTCLRHLDMDSSKITGIGKLIHLQGSVKFHVKNEKGHTLGDLDGMSSLRKELHIKNLDVVTKQEEACQAGLNKKENVKVLELEWNSTGKSVPSVEAEVLNGLEPHHYVKRLIIRRYHDNRSPNWLSTSTFYFKYLHLINCRKREVLPPLGQLPCLKVLHLKEMCSVKEIGCEFYGTNPIAFPYLEELEFDDMPQWVEWTQEEKSTDMFPKLRKLKLLNCPELIKVPQLPLFVRKVSVKNTGFVSQLKLSSSSSSSKAHKFALDTCSATAFTNGLMHKQQLEPISILTLRNCQDVKFEELRVLTSLKRLQISHSSINDEQLCTCLRGLQVLTWLEISNCNNITCLPQMESSDCLTKLHELHIQQCSEFSSLHPMPSFAALESILIENCSKITVKSFPTNFNSNTTLRKLSIMNCAELESLPSGFPSSLQVLHLIGCKANLMNQLQLKDGPEWDKVASIPIKQIR
ncbi:unnamed protein product [Miscanthus lutarioriparius]|uniref:Uncharacterized protein n=1 Tax=Miscanthus lutarioriparius TaxID=422564 RepID=A0A811RV90_9POAL|nr:unnamed protein product [Miscanthus lutarioriparius]